MVYDAVVIIAQSRMQDRYREAALHPLLAEAAPAAMARGRFAIGIGHVFVRIGERIEGVRYVPIASLSSGRSSR